MRIELRDGNLLIWETNRQNNDIVFDSSKDTEVAELLNKLNELKGKEILD